MRWPTKLAAVICLLLGLFPVRLDSPGELAELVVIKVLFVLPVVLLILFREIGYYALILVTGALALYALSNGGPVCAIPELICFVLLAIDRPHTWRKSEDRQ